MIFPHALQPYALPLGILIPYAWMFLCEFYLEGKHPQSVASPPDITCSLYPLFSGFVTGKRSVSLLLLLTSCFQSCKHSQGGWTRPNCLVVNKQHRVDVQSLRRCCKLVVVSRCRWPLIYFGSRDNQLFFLLAFPFFLPFSFFPPIHSSITAFELCSSGSVSRRVFSPFHFTLSS